MAKQKNVPIGLAKVVSDYGVSQREIGEAFGVSQSTISRKINKDSK